MADDLDRELRDILRAEASQWSPANPLDQTRHLLPERIDQRRRRLTATWVTIAAAMLVVALIAAAPSPGPDATLHLAGPTAPNGAGRGPGSSQAPGGGNVCAGACGTPTSVGIGPAGASVTSVPVGSGPPAGRAITTVPVPVPVTRPAPPTTAPPGGTVPSTVAVTTEPPTTNPPPPPGQVHVYTEADRGLTVHVNAHDRIILNLEQCSGAVWTEPDTSNAAVLVRLSASVDARAGSASAMFSALSVGGAQLTAGVERTACASAPSSFVLTVVVDGVSKAP